VELPNPPRRPVQLGGYAITLDKAVDWFFKQNPDIQAAQEKLKSAQSSPPQTGNSQAGKTSDAAISKAERNLAEVARERLLELKRSFYEAVLARLLIYEAEENLTYFDNYINRWQARYEEGIAPESEVTKWKFERTRVVDAMAELKLAERLARIRFFALLGGANSTIYGQLYVYLDDAPATPMKQTPEEFVEAGLHQRGRMADAWATLKSEIWREVESAYVAAEIHRERAIAIKSQQIVQSEYLRGVAASYYNESEAPLIVLLDAQRARWEVRQKYWRALTDYYISLAELEAAVGNPLKEINP
jgi:outer membrane protein TolC